MPIASSIDEVVQGARLINFLPYLKEEIDKMISTVDAKVQVQLSDGTLTPEQALNFWLERASYTNLYKRLETKARVAVSKGGKERANMEAKS